MICFKLSYFHSGFNDIFPQAMVKVAKTAWITEPCQFFETGTAAVGSGHLVLLTIFGRVGSKLICASWNLEQAFTDLIWVDLFAVCLPCFGFQGGGTSCSYIHIHPYHIPLRCFPLGSSPFGHHDSLQESQHLEPVTFMTNFNLHRF